MPRTVGLMQGGYGRERGSCWRFSWRYSQGDVGAIVSIGQREPLTVLRSINTEPYLICASREFRRKIEPHPRKLELIRAVVGGGEIDLPAQYALLIYQMNEKFELFTPEFAPGQLDRDDLSRAMRLTAGAPFADFKRPVKPDVRVYNAHEIGRGEGKHNSLFASQPLCMRDKVVFLDVRVEHFVPAIDIEVVKQEPDR